METTRRFAELSEDGRPFEDETVTVPCVRQSLLELLSLAREREGLALEGAWRLAPPVGRELRDRTGYVPAGGWRGLASLAAGCGVLRAGRDEFRALGDREEVADWGKAEATRRLLESFTRRLVPPKTAAGLFILLGIHPAWGVHTAHRSHRRFDGAGEMPVEASDGPSDRGELFPQRVARLVDSAVFEAVASLVAALRSLDPERVYSVDALSQFVEALCARVRSRAETRYEELRERGLDPFVDLEERRGSWRVIDFTTKDLIEGLLVPAGAAHRFNDDTFCVFDRVFSDVRVGRLDERQQEEVLADLVSSGSDHRVA